jgi:hypothetical protein
MTTRGTLKTEILDDMERSATTDGARVLSAISTAIKFYQPKRFFFNESRSITFSTVAGTGTYSFGASEAITTEFYRIDGVFILEGTNQHRVKLVDYLVLEELIENPAAEGRPTCYGFINRAMRFYRAPDAVYTVRIDGHIKAAEPAEDSTADNVWFTEAYELIRSRAKAYLYAHVYMDPQMAALMRQAESEAFGVLRAASTDKLASGDIVPTTF